MIILFFASCLLFVEPSFAMEKAERQSLLSALASRRRAAADEVESRLLTQLIEAESIEELSQALKSSDKSDEEKFKSFYEFLNIHCLQDKTGFYFRKIQFLFKQFQPILKDVLIALPLVDAKLFTQKIKDVLQNMSALEMSYRESLHATLERPQRRDESSSESASSGSIEKKESASTAPQLVSEHVDNCPICLDKLDGTQRVRFLCHDTHVYHLGCVHQLVQENQNPTCPTCRAPVRVADRSLLMEKPVLWKQLIESRNITFESEDMTVDQGAAQARINELNVLVMLLQSQQEDLKEQNGALKESLKGQQELEELMNTIHGTNLELQRQKEQLERDLSTARQGYRQLEMQIADHQSTILQLRTREQVFNEAHETIIGLRNKLAEGEAVLAQMSGTSQEIERARVTILEENKGLKMQLEQALSDTKYLMLELELITVLLSDSQMRVDQLSQSLDRSIEQSRLEMDQLRNRLLDEQQRLDGLKTEFQSERSAMVHERAAALAEIEQMRANFQRSAKSEELLIALQAEFREKKEQSEKERTELEIRLKQAEERAYRAEQGAKNKAREALQLDAFSLQPGEKVSAVTMGLALSPLILFGSLIFTVAYEGCFWKPFDGSASLDISQVYANAYS
jgi:hypothetical protein